MRFYYFSSDVSRCANSPHAGPITKYQAANDSQGKGGHVTII